MDERLTDLMDAAAAGGAYADARFVRQRSEFIATRNGEVDDLHRDEDEGIGVRVRVGGAWGFAATRERVSSGSPYEPVVGFSRAVRVGNIIAVAGTGPIGPDGETVGPGDVAAQMRRCVEIALAAIEELGGAPEDVIRTRTFLKRREDWEEASRVHGEFFGDIRPTSTMLQVASMIDPDWLVEFEADAVIGD